MASCRRCRSKRGREAGKKPKTTTKKIGKLVTGNRRRCGEQHPCAAGTGSAEGRLHLHAWGEWQGGDTRQGLQDEDGDIREGAGGKVHALFSSRSIALSAENDRRARRADAERYRSKLARDSGASSAAAANPLAKARSPGRFLAIPGGRFHGKAKMGQDGQLRGRRADRRKRYQLDVREAGLDAALGLRRRSAVSRMEFDIELPTGRIDGKLVGFTPPPKGRDESAARSNCSALDVSVAQVVAGCTVHVWTRTRSADLLSSTSARPVHDCRLSTFDSGHDRPRR